MAEQAATVRFRVLGSLRAETANGPAQLGGPKQRAVFAMLVAAGGKPVSVDRIIDGVWGENAPDAVKASVQSYISNLRSALGGGIERVGDGYQLEVVPAEVDAAVFVSLLDEGRQLMATNTRQASGMLREALSLWRGRPYADLDDVPGLEAEIRQLEELRLAAVDSRVTADIADGRHQVVIGELEALTAEHPFHEGFRANHMIALYRDGRQAEALRAYQRTREVLATELGVDPSPELQDLEQRILSHDPDLLRAADVQTQLVAFLAVGIESSAKQWETQPEQMRDTLARVDRILIDTVEEVGGRIFRHSNEGVVAAFSEVAPAAHVAKNAQQSLAVLDWGSLDPFVIRIAIDVGEVEVRAGEFSGPPLRRAARYMVAAHGGQILLTSAARDALSNEAGIQILNLGEHRFRGLGEPQSTYQLVVEGQPRDFPALRLDATGPESVPADRDAIRGFELRDKIGSGRSGDVYRAYQRSVGREVAIKIIRPEVANHPDFVRRFEGEARMVANLEHPHIVALYDFWRDHEGAYLVMPLMSGGSLAGRTVDSIDELMTVLRQVGQGLAFAHREGVIHRDIKPSNIVFDGSGNAYLGGFQVAGDDIGEGASRVYRAPESVAGVIDERTDIYSLGAVLVEALTGAFPNPDGVGRLPRDVAVALTRATAAAQDVRFRTVTAFVTTLEGAAGDNAVAVLAPPRNPYKGLVAFDVHDARDFYGREKEVADLLELVAEHRFVTVVGPSGSGKSSLVRAGLLPAVMVSSFQGSAPWLTTTMLPGSQPFDQLALALDVIGTEPLGDIVEEFWSSPDGLANVLRRMGSAMDTNILLVIDQFEELYTHVNDDGLRRRFLESLIAAVDDPESPLRIVATIRADFFHRPLMDDLLAGRVSVSHLAIGVPDRERLLNIVELPAESAGIRLESGLAERVVADVREQPGALPLVQFMMADLVDSSGGGTIDVSQYRDRGGIRGVIGSRAAEVFTGLEPEEQAVAAQVFVRLVTVGAEVDDVRRRVRRSELEGLGFDRASLDHVIDAFGSARLLTFDRDPVTRSPTVEVAHEALLREWPQLQTWVTERRRSLIEHRRLAAALEDWENAAQAPDLLPTGGRLAQFEEWLTDPAVTETEAERSFVGAAIAQREQAAAGRRRRRNAILGGFAAAAVIASLLVVATWVQWQKADEEAALARAGELVLEAEKVIATAPELGVNLALRAVGGFEEFGDVPSSAIVALRNAVNADRVRLRLPGGGFVAVSHDGAILVTADGEGGMAVWDREAADLMETVKIPNARISHVFASAVSDEFFIRATSVDGPGSNAYVWDSATGNIGQLPDPPETLCVECVMVSPDGAVVLTKEAVSREVVHVVAVDRATGDELYRIEDSLSSPSFSPDSRLAYGTLVDDSPVLKILGTDTGEVLQTLPDIPFVPDFVAFAGDGFRLILATQIELAMIDLRDGSLTWATAAPSRAFTPIWLPDDNHFLIGGEGLLTVIDAGTGDVVSQVGGHQGGSWSYQLVAGTSLIATAGLSDQTTLLLDIAGSRVGEVATFESPPWEVLKLAVGAGDAPLLALDRRFVSVHDSRSGAALISERGSDFGPNVVQTSYSRDAGYISAPDAGQSTMWSSRQGSVAYIAPSGWIIRGINNDGSQVVLGQLPGPGVDPARAQLIRTSDESQVAELGAGAGLHRAAFSPDGSYVVTVDALSVDLPPPAVWAIEDGSLAAELGSPDEMAVATWVEFSADSDRMVVSTVAGEVLVYDFAVLVGDTTADALVTRIDAHDSLIHNVTISADGSMVASSSWDEPVKLWDATTGAPLGEFGGAPLSSVAFHPEEPWLYVAEGGSITVHTLDLDELIEIARSRLTRTLTEEECIRYLQSSCAGS